MRKEAHSYQYWNWNINTYADGALDIWLNDDYINLFSSSLKEKMSTTSFYYTIGGYNSEGGHNSEIAVLQRKSFMLSVTELGLEGHAPAQHEGTILPTASVLQAISELPGQFPNHQWTRSPNPDTYDQAFTAFYENGQPGISWTGLNLRMPARPCFTLPNTALVDADLNLIES